MTAHPVPDIGVQSQSPAQLIEAVISGGAPVSGSLCNELLKASDRLCEQVSRRDHPDVMRSWPLSWSTVHGPWFEDLPIEILPARPAAPLDDALRKRVAEAAYSSPNSSYRPDTFFDALFNPRWFDEAPEDHRRHTLWIALCVLTLNPDPWTRDGIYNRPWPSHPDPHVRSLVLSLAYIDLPWPPAERCLYHATHDTDELVFLKAFRICGRRHDERSMDHLAPIVRSPAAVLAELAQGRMHYPVGHAACSICPSQFAILGTDDPRIARERESSLRQRMRRPLSELIEHARPLLAASIEGFVPPDLPTTPPPDLGAMIPIPGGPCRIGVDQKEVAHEAFNWSTCTPERRIEVPEFYIDPYPVTNDQYDRWEREVASLPPEERRWFEHPGQTVAKPHRRNTLGDPRFGPDHPVVGIDWFDAWAYARWAGKWLPSEVQWEKASRGPNGTWYPWGNKFDPGRVRYAGETYGRDPESLLHWVMLLSRGTSEFPERTTAPVTAHPEGRSAYGVHDMCGNCWEFTSTSFFTRNEARPAFAEFTPIELMGSREGHIVIRGGAWSSPAPLIGAAYRGFDLLTDRHTEIGFRCVWSPKAGKENVVAGSPNHEEENR